MSASVSLPTKWINLSVILKDHHKFSPKYITSINAREFIIVSRVSGNGRLAKRSLYKYSIDTNAFDELCIDTNQSFYSKMTVNNKEQILYVRNGTDHEIVSINTRTNNSSTLKGAKSGAYFLFVCNYFHVINMHNNHWIGSIQNESVNTVHNTIAVNTDFPQRLIGGNAVYIPSKQCILLIGGFYINNGSPKGAWIYKLTSQKWVKINQITFDRQIFEAILTSNERYIILLGGITNPGNAISKREDGIWVLDMNDDNNWTIKECKIKCPSSGSCIGTRTGGIDSKNDILVMGFVKECFKMKQFNNLQLPPQYIIGLISNWYSAEMIHWMQNKKHYGIYLKHILQSLY